MSASPDGTVKIWDAKTGKNTSIPAHTKRCLAAVWSADDKNFATVGSDRIINYMDTRNLSKPVWRNTEVDSCLMSCDFLNDKKYLVSSTLEGVLHFTDLTTGKHKLSVNTLDHTPEISSNIIYCVKSVKSHPKF